MNVSENAAYFHYRPGAWLRVSGPDAAAWMQGQFTNDLSGVGKGQSVYGLWLNQKGKIIADSFVICGSSEGEFWVGSYFCPAEAVRRRLEDYIIADDVMIEDQTDQWAGSSVLGEGIEAPVASESLPGIFFRGRRQKIESWEWMYPVSSADRVAEHFVGGRPLSSADMERRRIEAGLPAVPADAGPGDLPNEAGLEAATISYTKGCYLGQEIMARLKLRGRVRRQLMQIRGTGPLPAVPAPLWQEGRPAGQLRSAVGEAGETFIGMAMLDLALLNRDAPLSFSSEEIATVRLI